MQSSEFRIVGASIARPSSEFSEQIKTVDNCFYLSECAETRSNGSKACPCEQDDYVSRVGAERRISC